MNQNRTKSQNFSIVEDNGGTISIIIHKEGDESGETCIMAFFDDWTVLTAAVKDLFAGADPSDWENAVEDPKVFWDSFTTDNRLNGGWKYIANSRCGWFDSEIFGNAGQSLYDACQS